MFNIIERSQSDRKGYNFWLEIGMRDPDFLQKAENVAQKGHLVAAQAKGIVTLPTEQRKGVQRQLARQFIEREKPLLIVGESCNPAAVAARAHVYDEHGYRTFFGKTEVTPGATESGIPHKAVLLAHLLLLELPSSLDEMITIHGPSKINTLEFSPLIQKAFKPLTGVKGTTDRLNPGFSLISIKRELLSE